MNGSLARLLRIGALCAAALLAGCADMPMPGLGGGSSAGAGGSPSPAAGGATSQRAHAMADAAAYQPVQYANAAKKGPQVVVLPGEVKSGNATFVQRFGPNNIADYAELELARANFTVLERSDLGPLLREAELAYNLGDEAAARRLFQRGRLQATRWVLRFDVLKAEPVAQAARSVEGGTLGGLLGILGGGGRGAAAAGQVAGSVQASESSGVWLVGMRYKVIDASTTQQVATGYVEDRMELGTRASSVVGVSVGASGGLTLDTLVQRLVQKNVAEIDAKYK